MTLISLCAALFTPVSIAGLCIGSWLGFKHDRPELRVACLASCLLIVFMMMTMPIPSV